MKRFLALVHARNLEFVRDRAALLWAILFPALMIIGCALVFSRGEGKILTVGYLDDSAASVTARFPGLQQAAVDLQHYSDRELALRRLRYHQLDLLVDAAHQHYWLNPASGKAPVAEHLLAAGQPAGLTREAVGGRAIRYVDWALPGILGMNMMFAALFGVGYVVVRYRMNGVLKRLQATPTTALEFLAAQVTSRLLLTLSATAIIFAGCNALLGFLVLGRYLDLLVVGAFGGLAMISLGLLISSRTDSEEFAGGLLNLCTWPMMFLSEVWFPLDNAPAWVREFSATLPLTHLVAAARAIMLEGATLADVSPHLLALAMTTAVLLALASLVFRWHRG